MSTHFDELIEKLLVLDAELKEAKKALKEIEGDLPMELEDKMLTLKDLRKEVKSLKDEHLKRLLGENPDYVELREKILELKEEKAEKRLAVFTEAANQSREHGDLDRTVVVEGTPCRLQTQREVTVYLNGKVMK